MIPAVRDLMNWVKKSKGRTFRAEGDGTAYVLRLRWFDDKRDLYEYTATAAEFEDAIREALDRADDDTVEIVTHAPEECDS